MSDPVFRQRFACYPVGMESEMPFAGGMTKLRCAKCGRSFRKEVVYGYPGPELLEQAGRGEVVLGGCGIGDPIDPWWCDDCEPVSIEDR
jgi:hypothetical protein